MSRYKITFPALMSCCMAALSAMFMTACVDEIPGYGYGDIPEGEVAVNLQTSFASFTEAVVSRSSTTIPGNAMEDLSDLCLIAYDNSGKLIDNDYFENGVLNISFTDNDIKSENRNDSDASNGDNAEAATKCLTKDGLKLPTGRYYLIAVANLGDYTRNDNGTITANESTYHALTDGKYKGKFSTLDDLRHMLVSWDLENYANNREMLGFFTDSKDNVPSSNTQFTTVAITRTGQPLHAWLRRCASKVTIDFDGSDLRENVRIYLKEARIYDIPQACTLGFGRGADPTVDYNSKATKDGIQLYSQDETNLTNVIVYGEGEDHELWPTVTKGTPHGAYLINKTEDSDNSSASSKVFPYESLHSETANALFFYENMQGDAPRDKFQIADLENGGVADANDEKDGVPYGSYIEVVAHYYNTTSDAMGEGDIKYRFMLGKDAIRDCNAERNYHFKLTLKLRGNGNDYDWHIDYKDTKPFDIPNPWYVSYLYNHDANLPFKYTVPDGYEVVKFVARITDNPWYPAGGEAPDGELDYAFKYTNNRDNGNGFLSLRETDNLIVTPTDAGFPEVDNNGTFDYWNSNTYINMNHDYFYGTGKSTSTINRSVREYIVDGTVDMDTISEREKYSYQKDGSKILVNIPLFTRAKVLVKQTGYSGNNPYVGYERHATLEITPYIRPIGSTGKGEAQDPETTTVVQVRRIVNPKGVYRSAGKNENFNVELMYLPGDNEPSFESFNSDGPWMAEIIGDKNFITLDGKQIVTGSTETPIKFQIRFNKLNTDPNADPKNAVVRVRYNNYTCTHLIFVRQGYKAQRITPAQSGVDYNGTNQTSTVWSTFNMITNTVPASDPRDEGSMFKYGNESSFIDASCNVYTSDGKYGGTPQLSFPSDEAFRTPPAIYIVDKVDANTKKTTVKASTWAIPGGNNTTGFATMNVATARDFEQLYRSDNVQFGYGVLYADGATSTLTDVNSAYGWSRGDGDNTKGMRGMFAYYWDRNNPNDPDNARNVFFPIGRSGYGHRKSQKGADVDGTLRYSCNRDSYEERFKYVAPLFCGLYRRPGALYWAKTPVDEWLAWDGKPETSLNGDKKRPITNKFFGLDINYFSFDVNYITGANVSSGKDACFVRCVE